MQCCCWSWNANVKLIAKRKSHEFYNLLDTDLSASSPYDMCQSKQESGVLETLMYVFINSGNDFWTHLYG